MKLYTIGLYIFSLAISLLMGDFAHAMELEISVGHTQFEKPDNGIWWQNPFPNTMDTTSPSYSIGLTDRFSNGLRWRTTYTHLGNINGNAQATPRDDQYNGVNGCVGQCPLMNTFITEGSIRGFSFTVAPELTLLTGIKGFIEVGAFIYQPKFTATVWATDQPKEIPWRNDYKEGWQVGPQLGLGIEVDKTQLVFTMYKTATPTPDENAATNYKAITMNLSLRQRF